MSDIDRLNLTRKTLMLQCEDCDDFVMELTPIRRPDGVYALCSECVRVELKPKNQHEEEDE